jgi:UDP-N-acetylmuramyl pentapeptide phosphotransferase/UDP-N-acetylglucosamine-1-phosphate transferase
MPLKEIAFLVGISFGVSTIVTWSLCKLGSRFGIVDHPNERSLHSHPTPRSGGIGIMIGFLVSVLGAVALLDDVTDLAWVGVAAVLVAATSFADDLAQLPAGVRILVHFVAAGLVAYGGLVLDVPLLPADTGRLVPALVLPATVLFLVWMVNLYNFMDGMDGFAAGMTISGFGTLASLGLLHGDGVFAAFGYCIAAAAAGFLMFNFPPARIFMGDTGSSTLGLLAGVYSIWGAQLQVFPFWAALVVFSPFIVDATVTLLRRAVQKEKLWEAHRTHYYQRLVRLGWGHRRTVVWEYGVMAVCALSAFQAVRGVPAMQWLVLVSWLCVYTLLGYMVYRLEVRTREGCRDTG